MGHAALAALPRRHRRTAGGTRPPTSTTTTATSTASRSTSRPSAAASWRCGSPRSADIVFENYRADVIGKLGLDYDDLRAVKPDIILVSMPQPREDRPGVAPRRLRHERRAARRPRVAHRLPGHGRRTSRRSRTATRTPAPSPPPPRSPRCTIARETGEGQHVEVAQWEAMIGNIGEFVLGYQMGPSDIDWSESASATATSRASRASIACARRDEWVADLRRHRRRVRRALRRRSATPNSRATRASPTSSRAATTTTISTRSSPTGRATRSQDDAARSCRPPASPRPRCCKIPRLMQDEHLRARGFWETVAHADAGTWDMEGPVWRMSRHARPHPPRPPRMFGEHNDWVLRDLLGLSDAEIADLEAEGVTAREPNARRPFVAAGAAVPSGARTTDDPATASQRVRPHRH